MRNNALTTSREVVIESGEELVSATDSSSYVTFCNDTFCRVSGFSREEMISQPHNIIRHPDMPKAVFAELWNSLKQGQPWMGIVKNRTKSGGFYWVDAYITPLRHKGKVTGYESVRIKADRAAIERAEGAYQRINKGQRAVPLLNRWRALLRDFSTSAVTVLVCYLLGLWFNQSISLGSVAVGVGLAIAGGAALAWIARQYRQQALGIAHRIVCDPLTAYIYTGRGDGVGELELAQVAQAARLRTALGRLMESAKEVAQRSEMSLEQARCSHNGMTAQQLESEKVAVAMQQMSLAVQEVATGASQTSSATQEALEQVHQGGHVLNGASAAIQGLSENVSHLGGVVSRLSEDSAQIATVVDVIREIAEQTNL